MLKTGMIIAERYEILGKIGTGGMADVYKAKDHKLNRFVAAKVLKPEFREDATFIQKFRSEAQAAAGLTHPNIVNVFDVGDDDGIYYIVMELIEGITLKEYISKKGRLSVKEATSIAIQVSMGLETAHNHGIVHRDVKPQNIIISTDGKVKVTDFGIARAASSNTISSNVMGSVHYSSPEQVRGGYSDEKSDIYSLGITLYEMVTGRVPFDGDTTVAIAIKHLQEEMVPPSVYAEDLPYSLEQIILKCTQKSVGRRYDRMEEVIEDLKHSLIEPRGDFVKLSEVDTEAKTVVISDKELGEIKHTPKQTSRTGSRRNETEDTEQDYDDGDYDNGNDDYEERRSREKKRRIKADRNRSLGRIITILALIIGAAALMLLIVYIGKASGLIGGSLVEGIRKEKVENTDKDDDSDLVTVPNLIGCTEAEAAEIANSSKLGIQIMGEQASDQEKGRICYQDIPEGSQVEAFSTVKYYVSKGAQSVTVPDTDGRTGADAQQILEDAGFKVEIKKVYSDLDENGYVLVNPGYAYYTEPDAGTSAKVGDTVILYVSRGLDYGDSAEVPDVVGWELDEALTFLGKWLEINVVEEKSTAVNEGEVVRTEPKAYSYANPDEPLTVYISCGNKEPAVSPTPTPEPAEPTAAPQTTASQTQSSTQVQSATGADGTWKCTQWLDNPTGYAGGLIRLELLQEINGMPTASTIVDGQVLQFPYQLNVSGAAGVTEGKLYLYEQVNGEYKQLGMYQLTFEKAE